MARSTPEEIRRRIAKRKRDKGISPSKRKEPQLFWPGEEEKYGFPPASSGDGRMDSGHPLFKKEVFFFKLMASVMLFLVVAILFRNQNPALNPARNLVIQSMGQDFQFAAVSKWYEDKFGRPLALLPFPNNTKPGSSTTAQKEYSVPASGKILENFQKNGQGIMIETGKGTEVKAVKDGLVNFAGVKDGLGKTVIIQHADNTETWYGNLAAINVSLYEYVAKQTVVGTVSDSTGSDKTKGEYYFAIKKGNSFIDPIQVIRFE